MKAKNYQFKLLKLNREKKSIDKKLKMITNNIAKNKLKGLEISEILGESNNIENEPNNDNNAHPQWRDGSVISAKTKDMDKSMNVSKLDSFMTNVSKRYQGEVDDDDHLGSDDDDDIFYDTSITQKSYNGKRTPLKSQTMRERSFSPLLPYNREKRRQRSKNNSR